MGGVLGLFVGPWVGSADGFSVGSWVGIGVGDIDGFVVGPCDGCFVGFSVVVGSGAGSLGSSSRSVGLVGMDDNSTSNATS